MQPQQQGFFLSDGADTLRRLQQNIAPEAEHVLDWFHLAMRLTVLGQMIKSALTEAATAEAKAAALERIKWLLWHGNAPDAVDDIECLVDDVTAELEDNPTSASLRKLAAALGEFATYIANNAGHVVNYGERFRAGEPISTGFVEFCDQPNRGQALRQTSIDALETSGCTPTASDPKYASSTTTSIKSSVAATPPSGDHRPPTFPPLCDGLERPRLHQRERTVALRENDVRRHHADDARIVPVIAGKAGIRRMSIGDQRRARLHVGAHEGFERRRGVVGDHGEA